MAYIAVARLSPSRSGRAYKLAARALPMGPGPADNAHTLVWRIRLVVAEYQGVWGRSRARHKAGQTLLLLDIRVADELLG